MPQKPVLGKQVPSQPALVPRTGTCACLHGCTQCLEKGLRHGGCSVSTCYNRAWSPLPQGAAGPAHSHRLHGSYYAEVVLDPRPSAAPPTCPEPKRAWYFLLVSG